MILITDATSFVGRAITRHLVSTDRAVCCLLQPSKKEQRLPTGIRCNTVAASMNNLPALRTSLQDVSAVVHSIADDDLDQDEGGTNHLASTTTLIEAMRDAEVTRLIYLSRVGADRTSAYPILKKRGEAEALVKACKLHTTVLQPTLTYGPDDTFTNVTAMIAKTVPLLLPIPDTGMARFQPLAADDLAACVRMCLDRDDLIGQTISLGGSEYFTYHHMISAILAATGTRRHLVQIRMGLMHGISDLLERILPVNPVPRWFLNLLDAGLTTELRVIPNQFGFEPQRFDKGIRYLNTSRRWRRDLARYVLRGQW